MTLRGSRWNSGLMDVVGSQLVVHAFGSFRPIVWNASIMVVSMRAVMMMNRIDAVSPFGVVHLMIWRRGVGVVKLLVSPVGLCWCLLVFG